MRDFYAKTVMIISDILAIYSSIFLGYELRVLLDSSLEKGFFFHNLSLYLNFLPLFLPILLFMYEGIYTKRFDFWHESREIIKSLILSFILVMAYLALTKSIENYSRLTIIFSFLFMMFVVPISKLIIKKVLFSLKLWAKKATIYGE